jgi:hypothetical protein
MASVVSNLLAAFTKHATDTPNLIWPYVTTPEDMADEANAVLAAAKKIMHDGTLARKHGDTPGA